MVCIKGKCDIMGIINYFFELYDDDGDGRVDCEGILCMFEVLFFLFCCGLEGMLSLLSLNFVFSIDNVNGGGENLGYFINERFFGSVSVFIRRCFEYVDLDYL